ncbi:MAG: zinc ABC transporter substrate-binding protein [Clostridia bacterium]|nr:zinc ABC transporter substrate-binding protein [Clostridia bacterium]
MNGRSGWRGPAARAIIGAASLMLCLVMTLAAVGCGSGSGSERSGGKLKIVATVFPAFDWAREIVGEGNDGVELTFLLDHGVDLHSYQPTAFDVASIKSCDVFIYVGGESEKWVENTLKAAPNESRTVIDLLDVLGEHAKEEETVEGMECEEKDEEEEEGVEYDEHVWLSLKNAALFCESICRALCAADPANADGYKANAEAYVEKLTKLDGEYEAAVEAAPVKTLVFGDRFPFRYLTDDYGITYYAAFVGCSAETEASFKTVVFLAGKVDELGLGSIMRIETSDGSIARTIRDNTKSKDQKILILDSLQSKTGDDVRNGTSYLSVMEENLSALKEALKK